MFFFVSFVYLILFLETSYGEIAQAILYMYVCQEALLPLWKRAFPQPTCALGPAEQWWPWAACASISRAGKQHADLILSVRV